jgi:hypothetical protein
VGNGDMLDIVVHKNVQVSEDTVSDTLDSDHLSIAIHLLDLVRTRNLSDPVEKFTDLECFQSLASKVIHLKSKLTQGKKLIKQPATLLPL